MDIDYTDMKASELLRELIANGRLNVRRQSFDKFIARGLVPYWLNKKGEKRFDYDDALKELLKSGRATGDYI